jgi:hypothetical protein
LQKEAEAQHKEAEGMRLVMEAQQKLMMEAQQKHAYDMRLMMEAQQKQA